MKKISAVFLMLCMVLTCLVLTISAETVPTTDSNEIVIDISADSGLKTSNTTGNGTFINAPKSFAATDISTYDWVEFDVDVTNKNAFRSTKFAIELKSSNDGTVRISPLLSGLATAEWHEGVNHIRIPLTLFYATSGTIDMTKVNYFRIFDLEGITAGTGVQMIVSGLKFTKDVKNYTSIEVPEFKRTLNGATDDCAINNAYTARWENKTSVTATQTIKQTYSSPLDVTDYKYIEFDIGYTNALITFNFELTSSNGKVCQTIGNFAQYADAPIHMGLNHIIIPLDSFMTDGGVDFSALTKIEIYTADGRSTNPIVGWQTYQVNNKYKSGYMLANLRFTNRDQFEETETNSYISYANKESDTDYFVSVGKDGTAGNAFYYAQGNTSVIMKYDLSESAKYATRMSWGAKISGKEQQILLSLDGENWIEAHQSINASAATRYLLVYFNSVFTIEELRAAKSVYVKLADPTPLASGDQSVASQLLSGAKNGTPI